MHDLLNQAISSLQWADAANRAAPFFPQAFIVFPALTILLYNALTGYGLLMRYRAGHFAVSVGSAILLVWHWSPYIAAISLVPFAFAPLLYLVAFSSRPERPRPAAIVADPADPGANAA